MSYLRLTIEPMPAESRLASLAKLLAREQWDRLRRSVYRRAYYRCQICGREGQLHCHELWQFNRQKNRQLLIGFQALCNDCHSVKHFLFVRDRQEQERLFQHLLTVNRLTRQQGQAYINTIRQRQKDIDKQKWIVDFASYNSHVPVLKGVIQRHRYVTMNYPKHSR